MNVSENRAVRSHSLDLDGDQQDGSLLAPLVAHVNERVEGSESEDELDSYAGGTPRIIPSTPFTRSPVLFFKERFQAGSVKGSIFTLVVAIVGSGTLSVPYAFQQSGVLLGILLFGLGAVTAFFSLQLLVVSSELTGIKSYKGIAEHLYGPGMSKFAQISLLLNLYGTSISYIVASGSMISTVLVVLFDENEDDVPFYLGQQFVMILTTCFIALPLSLMRTLGSLRFSSLIGVSCSIYLTIIVIILYFDFCSRKVVVSDSVEEQVVQCFWEEAEPTQTKIKLATDNVSEILSAIPIVIYAYTCHPNVLPIFLELQKPTRRRMSKVIYRAIFVAFGVYAILGSFAYFTFKDQLDRSDGNFLNNDYHHSPATQIGALGMSLSVILAIPLFVNAFRGNVYTLMKGDDSADQKYASAKFHYSVSIGIIVASLIPAILIKDISMVFTVLGSTTNPIICFILPGLFILRAAPPGMYYTEKTVSVLVAVTISIISIVSLIKNVKSWLDEA